MAIGALELASLPRRSQLWVMGPDLAAYTPDIVEEHLIGILLARCILIIAGACTCPDLSKRLSMSPCARSRRFWTSCCQKIRICPSTFGNRRVPHPYVPDVFESIMLLENRFCEDVLVVVILYSRRTRCCCSTIL